MILIICNIIEIIIVCDILMVSMSCIVKDPLEVEFRKSVMALLEIVYIPICSLIQ